MYITIDIGGTNTRIGLSNDLKNFDNIEKFQTPKNTSNISGKIQSIIKNYKDIDAICVGIAGLVDHKNNKLLISPHIPYLNNRHINEIIGDTNPETNIYLQNDAALAGLAEATTGDGKDYSRVAYITISTGVGGTMVIDKKLPNTRFSYEPGHHIIDFNGKSLALDAIKGSWEYYSSGTGFYEEYKLNPEELTDIDIWEDYGMKLSVGLHNISLLWQPEVIILGGSMSKKYQLFYKTMHESLNECLGDFKPEIRTSVLGDTNGISGGLIHIDNKLNKKK